MSLSTQTRLGLLVIGVALLLLGAGVVYDTTQGTPVAVGLTDVLMALFGGIVTVGLYHGWTMDVEDANPAEPE
jgi:hypothetical protein